jgi:hypothetical protein
MTTRRLAAILAADVVGAPAYWPITRTDAKL